MTPESFRKSLGLSQTAFAAELGVKSKAYVSDLERGVKPWPLKLALRLERISHGEVPAGSICPEARKLLAAEVRA